MSSENNKKEIEDINESFRENLVWGGFEFIENGKVYVIRHYAPSKEKISELIKSTGITPEEIVKITGIRKAFVSALKKGDYSVFEHRSVLKCFANHFDIPFPHLYDFRPGEKEEFAEYVNNTLKILDEKEVVQTLTEEAAEKYKIMCANTERFKSLCKIGKYQDNESGNIKYCLIDKQEIIHRIDVDAERINQTVIDCYEYGNKDPFDIFIEEQFEN